ncbi:hypothetical protein EBH_0084220 [Eimeria brunetti]|uniref:Uncharacterized protein n=1 Tax=Eimeria brunetti TaxID=51314 RepID=U6LHB1_9EIME|nr:hypothetical protein EBH_0084220 [Eimeria brunetti]
MSSVLRLIVQQQRKCAAIRGSVPGSYIGDAGIGSLAAVDGSGFRRQTEGRQTEKHRFHSFHSLIMFSEEEEGGVRLPRQAVDCDVQRRGVDTPVQLDERVVTLFSEECFMEWP